MEEILFRLIENVTHVTQPSKILRRNVLLPFFPYQCLSQKEYGVPVVVQWLPNPTRNHEVVGSVPALAQWVNDPALP